MLSGKHLSLSPTNAVAMTRLAQSLSRTSGQHSRTRVLAAAGPAGIAREARFWARRALQFASQDPEIRSACRNVLRDLSAPD